MEHLAQRCATVTAAALTVGGLVAALTSVTQPPSDLQLRDFDLVAARNVDTNPLIETMENHVRPELSGAGDDYEQHFSLGDLLHGSGLGSMEGITDPSSETSDLAMDEQVLTALLGGGLDAQALQDLGLSIQPIDMGVIGGGVVPPVGAFGASGQEVGSAAAGAVSGIAVTLPAAYEAFTGAVASMEADLNSSLVAAQTAAAEQLFGNDPAVDQVVNWIFTVNNTMLADNLSVFNNIFGIPIDAHASLLGHLDPGLDNADWSILLGLTPEEFTEIVNAIQSDNLSLLGGIDWAEMFSSLF